MNSQATIVIDARVVVENQGHGIARYTDEFLRHLAQIETPFRFVLLVNQSSPLLKQKWPANFSTKIMRTKWLAFLGQIEVAYWLWKLRPQLFHSPSFIVPFLSTTPLIATIHDLNHVVLSENYSVLHKLYYSILLARKIKTAKRVVTVSDFSKDEITRFFNIPTSSVTVIHNGINSRFKPLKDLDANIAAHFKERYELPPEYILSIGNRKPHKNMRRLVEAYCRGNFELPLVLLTEFDPELLRIAACFNKKHLIHFIRFISDDEFPYIYALAKIFVYPSLYEGFGLPPLEAAACGIPVVVSDRASLPEVMAQAAYYVNPEDTSDIIRGIKLALAGESPSCAMVLKGLELVNKYSWKNMVEKMMEIYRYTLKELVHGQS